MTDGKILAFMDDMSKIKLTKDQVVFDEGKIPEAVYII